ncbi:MAG: oligosaccharyl transferase stt3 subunit, partial [Watsoniomyces obsoletus]
LNLGSMFWGAMAALFYGYMVSAWGGYVFITNLIPLHIFVLILMGRYSSRIYIAYTTWYALGTLASMQVPFVGFLPIRSSDHMAPLGIFGLIQLVGFFSYLRDRLPGKQFQTLLVALGGAIFAISFLEFSAKLATPARVKNGRAQIGRNAATFDRVAQEFGVPASVITGFWALESDFGAGMG